MCRMLGIIGLKADYSLLKDFQKLSLTGKIKTTMTPGHLDGWGMTGFVKDEAAYFGKSEKPANEGENHWVTVTSDAVITSDNNGDCHQSQYKIAIEKAGKSQTPILIAHIRKASSGSISLQNTHPFIKNNWIFGHNGTIYEPEKIKLDYLKPTGTTDSERFFYFLLENLGDAKIVQSITSSVKKAVSYVWSNFDYTSLTFLLANQKFMIAYRDYNENSKEDISDLKSYYTLYFAKKDDFVAICSEPLASMNFRPLVNGELLIIPSDLTRISDTFLK